VHNTLVQNVQVLVTEREPVQALREVDILEKLTAKIEHLSDLGPVIESSTCGQISRVFERAAIPNRLQPYRYAHCLNLLVSTLERPLFSPSCVPFVSPWCA
jgi:hypothetical protein